MYPRHLDPARVTVCKRRIWHLISPALCQVVRVRAHDFTGRFQSTCSHRTHHTTVPEVLEFLSIFSTYTLAHWPSTSILTSYNAGDSAAATINFTKGSSLQVDSSFPYPQPPNTPINITLKTGQDMDMELALRIPSWLATPVGTVLLNRAPYATPPKGSFLKIKRVWQNGDTISLDLPMGFRATEYVGKNQISGRRRVAFEYGPVSLRLQELVAFRELILYASAMSCLRRCSQQYLQTLAAGPTVL